MEPARQTNLRTPLLVFLVIAALGIWALNTLNTGNPLWFLPIQPEYRPSRIVIRHYGTAATLRPRDDGYEQLVEAINQSFASFRNTTLIDVGLSDTTLQDYNDEGVILELYYPDFITFNTSVRMSNVNQLLFPVQGRHADQGYLFMGRDGAWRVGAMQVSDPEPIANALRDMGYLQEE